MPICVAIDILNLPMSGITAITIRDFQILLGHWDIAFYVNSTWKQKSNIYAKKDVPVFAYALNISYYGFN